MTALGALLGLDDDRHWLPEALCAQPGVIDPDAFFTTEGNAPAAVRVCRACPVREECRDWAIAHRVQYGIWGGNGPRSLRSNDTATERPCKRCSTPIVPLRGLLYCDPCGERVRVESRKASQRRRPMRSVQGVT